jgi:hypothetical protein
MGLKESIIWHGQIGPVPVFSVAYISLRAIYEFVKAGLPEQANSYTRKDILEVAPWIPKSVFTWRIAKIKVGTPLAAGKGHPNKFTLGEVVLILLFDQLFSLGVFAARGAAKYPPDFGLTTGDAEAMDILDPLSFVEHYAFDCVCKASVNNSRYESQVKTGRFFNLNLMPTALFEEELRGAVRETNKRKGT